MRTVRSLIALLLVLAGGSVPSRAGAGDESPLELLLDTIRANRRALVAVNLRLSPQEAERFWPVYDRYQERLAGIQDRLIAVIEEYTTSFATLSDARAQALVADYLEVESDRVALRRAVLEEIARALPGRKVARFYQIENKIDAVLRYDLAAHIPVIDE